MEYEDPKEFIKRVEAAKRGCGQCGAALKLRVAGEPFSGGPYVGTYWCNDCWTLYYEEHPEHLADKESKAYNQEEARRIRRKRASEVLYEEGDNRVYLTERGTVMFDLKSSVPLSMNEFDPERFQALLRAIQSMKTSKIPGYETVLVA